MDRVSLPITDIRERLKETLKKYSRFVLSAPTGSGKSTQVPQFILDDFLGDSGQIVVLQPRRLAARMLARRVAHERDCSLGDEVGYQMRLDRVCSEKTRILYVTEGILLRMIQDDPTLSHIAAVIFDEFHERHLYSDVSLAQVFEVQKRYRQDLLIGVMSATLETGPLMDYLAPVAQIQSDGQSYPVDIHYAANARAVADKPEWDQAAYQVSKFIKEDVPGDILIFMPGAYEIRRTVEALSEIYGLRNCVVLPLHGELPPREQDAVMEDFGKRKIIVATNVAETSLTIPGIRIVIDSGLARIPVFDTRRGINTILVTKISQASADQRAGRAGRMAPGVCVRLWGEKSHHERKVFEDAEVQRLDLSEIILLLKSFGVRDLNTFNWYEKPDELRIQGALNLLMNLGALRSEEGELTPLGRRMNEIPVHPRYSRMLIEAQSRGCLKSVCLIAAMSQERSLLLSIKDKRKREAREDLLLDELAKKSDFFQELRAWQLAASKNFDQSFCRQWGIHAGVSRQVDRLADRFYRLMNRGASFSSGGSEDFNEVRKVLLTGFSDQLAKRDGESSLRCSLSGGRRGEIDKHSIVRDEFFVSAEIEERNIRGMVTVLLRQNTTIEFDWLEEFFPDDFESFSETFYDSVARRVVQESGMRFRGLTLRSRVGDPSDMDAAARILANEVSEGHLILKKWTEKTDVWIQRVNFLAMHFPEYEIEPIEPEDRIMLLEQICYGAISYKELKDREVMAVLEDWLMPEQLPLIEVYAPLRFLLPNGKSAKVSYSNIKCPMLTAMIQQFYDIETNLKIGDRVPVKYEFLAPNQRPVQVTDDLPRFWRESYPMIKKDLKGRYPKHEWR